MSQPFSYLIYNDSSSRLDGNAESNLMDFTAGTTVTATDDASSYSGRMTPSITDDGINPPTASDPQVPSVNSLASPEPEGMPSAPEPTVLLSEIQQAAEDVSQLLGRFGYKMAGTMRKDSVKTALFANQNLLRLPCLQYADNFHCRATEQYAKQPICYMNSAPLLWWLWDELLKYLEPSDSRSCKLEFTPARKTDTTLPYTICINLAHKHNNDNIEFTAMYGGLFCELRIFDAPIARFQIPETERYGKTIINVLNIDREMYREGGCLAHTLNYLMPRSGSIWRHAMGAFDTDKEELLFVALAGICKAEDDRFFISESQAQQCSNLLQRFPREAKAYIFDQGLVGKKDGPYSTMAHRPDGPKD